MRKTLMRPLMLFLAVGLMMVLAACANFEENTADGYQIGDITSSVLETQADYCATSDPVKRAVLLGLLRTRIPDYPASGLCTDPLSVLPSIDASTAGGALDNVDVEQAIADQKAAQARQEVYDESPSPD